MAMENYSQYTHFVQSRDQIYIATKPKYKTNTTLPVFIAVMQNDQKDIVCILKEVFIEFFIAEIISLLKHYLCRFCSPVGKRRDSPMCGGLYIIVRY